MGRYRFAGYAWPLVGLGGLIAATGLVSTWAINRVQSDLARAIRHDVARLEAAQELQLRLRQLRLHAVLAAADPSPGRRREVADDRRLVEAALAAARREADAPDDHRLLDTIARGYDEYEDRLDVGADGQPLSGGPLLRWADAHPVRGLLVPCRELGDRQRERMDATLARTEEQTRWAGGVLLALGLTGALGGVVSGYATARGLNRRTAHLSVRVRAVQAQLDQEVGALTVEGSPDPADLDARLDRVVARVTEVCRRLQEQERTLLRADQLAAVGRLAAGVAHEIRNPLTGISFLVEGATRPGNPTPLTDEDLQLIHAEVLRIGRTVQGLLDFARTPPLDRRPHDLRDLVAEAAGLVRGRAGAKAVAVRVEAPPAPVTAAVDRDQFLSLATNLLFNAIDASPPGGEVAVALGPAAGTATVQLEVADRGPGIDPAVESRLFTPFATTKPTGTGLGLSVARRAAEDHGGTLAAAPRPGGGAVFTLTLPTLGGPDADPPGR